MANNYTISGNTTIFNPATEQFEGRFQQTELIGDVVVAGNIANWTPTGINNSTILTITPNSGYVISASDFSVTNLSNFTGILASENGVTFTDTGTAGTDSNTVIVKVNLDPTYQLTGGATDVISLDIDGSTGAVPWTPPNIDVATEIISEDDPGEADPGKDTNLNSNATVAITEATDFGKDTTLSGNTTTFEITGQAVPNVSQKISTLTVTADSGYELQTQPYLMYLNMPNNILRLAPSAVTRDSNNRITAYSFNMMYKNNIATKTKSGAKAFIKYETTKIPTATTEIKNITHGSYQVSNLGETRLIKVYGDPGAEFDLTITKNSDGSSIISDHIANADIFDTIGGIVRGINKKLASHGRGAGTTSFSFNQDFPAGSDKYFINIYAKTGTTLKSSMPTTIPHYTIEQYANPVLTLTATEASSNYSLTTYAAITYTGRPNTSPSQLKHISSIPKTFSFSYVATRASSYTFTTANSPTWSSTVQASSNWTNSVYADNDGTHLEIFNLKTATNHGATTATITGDVLIKKWGTANVTMNLDLDNILAAT